MSLDRHGYKQQLAYICIHLQFSQGIVIVTSVHIKQQINQLVADIHKCSTPQEVRHFQSHG